MTDPGSPTGIGIHPDAMQVTVVASDERSDADTRVDERVDVERWAKLAREALADLGASGEVTLCFVDRDDMQRLNHEFLGIDEPTDVLSFPLDDDEPIAGPKLIGDIIICPSVAAKYAPTHAGNLDDELALLVVHGALHVMGRDHADPATAAAMQAEESQLLRAYHWHGPSPDGFRHTHADQPPPGLAAHRSGTPASFRASDTPREDS